MSEKLTFPAWLGIALALLPIPIKRFVLTGEPDVESWLLWDYGSRLVVLAGMWIVYEKRVLGPPPKRASWLKSEAIFVAMLVLILLLTFVGPFWFSVLPPYFLTFTYPVIRSQGLLAFDLTVGIFLVAISEELVYRRLLFSLLERWRLTKGLVLLISSAIFALAHVTSGLPSVVSVFLAGLILGATFQLTGRLSLCVVLHYIEDFIIFGMHAYDARVIRVDIPLSPISS